MDYIEKISNQYDGEILLHDPYNGGTCENIPKEIYSILRISNGISETMHIATTNEKIEIGWVIYSHEMMLEWTSFYATNYGVKGIIFSDDGADCVYCIKPEGIITCFNSIDKDEIQIADTLWDFFDTLPIYRGDSKASRAGQRQDERRLRAAVQPTLTVFKTEYTPPPAASESSKSEKDLLLFAVYSSHRTGPRPR